MARWRLCLTLLSLVGTTIVGHGQVAPAPAPGLTPSCGGVGTPEEGRGEAVLPTLAEFFARQGLDPADPSALFGRLTKDLENLQFLGSEKGGWFMIFEQHRALYQTYFTWLVEDWRVAEDKIGFRLTLLQFEHHGFLSRASDYLTPMLSRPRRGEIEVWSANRLTLTLEREGASDAGASLPAWRMLLDFTNPTAALAPQRICECCRDYTGHGWCTTRDCDGQRHCRPSEIGGNLPSSGAACEWRTVGGNGTVGGILLFSSAASLGVGVYRARRKKCHGVI